MRIDQAAVPVDSGEPVPKLVCDARRELAETSERLLQPQLLFQLEHVRQVREQTDDAALAFGAGERRHRHAEVCGTAATGQAQQAPDDRPPCGQAFGNHVNERRDHREQLAIVSAGGVPGEVEQSAAGRVEDLDAPGQVDDKQPSGQALDNLPAQLFGRGRAGARRLFLRLEAGNDVLHAGRRVRPHVRPARAPPGVTGRRTEAEQRERDHRDEHGDQRGESEDRVTVRRPREEVSHPLATEAQRHEEHSRTMTLRVSMSPWPGSVNIS